ncbi:MAG: hypothetical protein IJX25_00170 [Clostridia bacterium]|nr:hypothetical protein [Clostridia bacterium]
MEKFQAVFDWLQTNGLVIRFGFRPRECNVSSIYCDLESVYGSLWIDEGCMLSGEHGNGNTFAECIEDMCKKYSGKKLIADYVDHLGKGKRKTKEYQFPLVIM